MKRLGLVAATLALAAPAAFAADLRLPDHPLPYLGDAELPRMTPPIIQIGDPFLQPGNIDRGFRLPGGAVWQPRFWVFGNLRSAAQSFDLGVEREAEWVSRLDLFGNLQLTGTERVLVGIQPLQREGRFTGQQVEPEKDFDNQTNGRIRTLFFEGDVGELFPALDRSDFGGWDTGFSIGRQPINFQGGLLINDTIDAVGITRNNLRGSGRTTLTNLRITALMGWDEVGRDDNGEDTAAKLYGLFMAWDSARGNRGGSTYELDLVFVDSDDPARGRLAAGGLAATQRIGHLNTTFRILGSHAIDETSTVADNGTLLNFEFSLTPSARHDLLYFTGFWAHEQFRSAARDALAGGPAGQVGLLFAARGLGRYPAPLSNRTTDAAGAALGYQLFANANRFQAIFELAARRDYGGDGATAGAVGLRLRQALGRRWLVDLDAFAVGRRDVEDSNGVRLEFQLKL